MIHEIAQFLLHVLASVIGILLGAWLAQAWEEAKRKIRNRRSRR